MPRSPRPRRSRRSRYRRLQTGIRSWRSPGLWLHDVSLMSGPESRLGNCCDPPGFRENSPPRAVPAAWRLPNLPETDADPCRRRLSNGLSRGREGPPLLCVHGTLGDFRTWSAVLGPLSKRHRVISVSLRHFFPAHWDGVGDDYRMVRHVADVIGFIERLDAAPVDLMGHSRGGHIAFRVTQQRPELLRRLVLAEPGGELDATLDPPHPPAPSQRTARFAAAAEKVAKGDIEGALKLFFDTIDGDGAWARLAVSAPAAIARQCRDADRTGQREPPAIQQAGRTIDPRPRRCSSAAPNAGRAARSAARIGGRTCPAPAPP